MKIEELRSSLTPDADGKAGYRHWHLMPPGRFNVLSSLGGSLRPPRYAGHRTPQRPTRRVHPQGARGNRAGRRDQTTARYSEARLGHTELHDGDPVQRGSVEGRGHTRRVGGCRVGGPCSRSLSDPCTHDAGPRTPSLEPAARSSARAPLRQRLGPSRGLLGFSRLSHSCALCRRVLSGPSCDGRRRGSKPATSRV